MIDMNREIRSLLFEHDYVTIPELGAFIAHYEPSAYRSESNTFSPPNRKISFNGVLKQDDGLLSTAFMQKFGLSSKLAKELIVAYVKDVKHVLISKGMFQIDGVGSLELTVNDKVVFEPVRLNFFNESYGFETLYSFNNANFTYDRKFYSDSYSLGLSTSIESMEIDYPFHKKSKPFYSKVLYVAPIAALIIGLMTTIVINPNKMDRAKSSFYPGDYAESVRGWFNSPEKKEAKFLAPKVSERTNTVKPGKERVISKPQTLSVLIGVFKDEQKANKLYNLLVLNDFVPTVVDSAGHKQVMVSVENDEEAKAVSARLKQLIGQSGVLIKK